MKSIWIAVYEDCEIKIENTWFNGARLYVNGKLQDERFGWYSTDLTGNIFTKNGEKHLIKVNLGGTLFVGCRLFIDDKKVDVKQLM